MHSIFKYPPSIILLLTIFIIAECKGQWSTDPSSNLFLCYGILPEACSDSMGGVYITSEYSLNYPRIVELRHLNRYGYMTWPNKVLIKGIFEESRYANIVADRKNGVFIAYFDRQQYPYPYLGLTHDRLRVQHVDSNGTLLWGPTGLLASFPDEPQVSELGAKILSDGEGGCIVAWIDTLDILKCQNIDESGNRLWGDSGLVITQIPQEKILIASDYKGGIYVRWGTQTNSCIQHILHNGAFQWDTNTVKMPIAFNQMETDKSGNIYIAGLTGNIHDYSYIVQKVDSSGISEWIKPFLVLADSISPGFYGDPILIDQDYNSTYFWNRNEDGLTHLYTQKLNSEGKIIYANGSVRVTPSNWSQWVPLMVNGYGENVIYTWREYDTTMHIYSQMLDSAGNKLWNQRGILTCDPGLQYQKMVTDCRGGFILVGYKDDFFSIMVQQVNRDGELGVVIDGINDKMKTAIPDVIHLYQNFPNPFNSATMINYDIHRKDYISLKLFDLAGRYIATLAEGDRTPGRYSVTVQTENLSSGTYFYVLQSLESKITKRLSFIK